MANFILQALFTFSLFLLPSNALVGPAPSNPDITIVQTIFGTESLENLAVRHNGHVLVTSTASPSVYHVSPTGAKAVIQVAQVPGATALTGIAELQQDVFFISASRLSGFEANGTCAVWKLDLRKFCVDNNGKILHPAALELVTRIPSAGLLNGMTRLASSDKARLLLADSGRGNVVLLNVNTKSHKVVIKDPTMSITSKGLAIGVNGVHTHGDELFYTSLNRGIFAKIPISLATGYAKGPAQVIVNGTLVAADDFALSKDGKRAWIAENGENVLIEVDIPAKTTSVAINSTAFQQGSSAFLSRGHLSPNILYATGASKFNSSSVGTLFQVHLK
ncbi:hypothetical protein B0T10DRAFT_407584 [Thelonectria olida]|uniref:Uncharacterized protein n=1 Tax=Thelonectria olida TaxID=1576542 RepID=A0A9P8W067_9HYPO|nr:hypothetical protein B0T10DRAFT_407584 [Thelonectria olida]